MPLPTFPSLYILLPAVLFLPTIVYTVANARSFGAGVLLASVLVIGISVLHLRRIESRSIAACAAIGIILILHAGLAYAVTGSYDWLRFSIGTAGILVVTAAAFSLCQRIDQSSDETVRKSVLFCVFAIAANAALPLIGVDLGLYTSVRPAGFYSEPSHLVMGLTTVLLFTMTQMPATVYVPITAFFVLWSALYGSLIGVAVAGFVCVAGAPWTWRTAVAFTACLAVALLYLGIDYVAPRLSILSIQGGNASTWVLVRGWEDAIFSLKQTYGVGLGFQQFGSLSANGPAYHALESIDREWINVLDGGSTAPKLIGEFGILGVIMVVALSIAAPISIIRLRTRTMSDGAALLACCVATIPIELYARGAGYFTPGMMLGVTGLISLLPEKVTPYDESPHVVQS